LHGTFQNKAHPDQNFLIFAFMLTIESLRIHWIVLPLTALTALLISYQSVQAQGNLQYNQTLLIGTTPQTVPAGKTWKVESVLSSASLAPSLPSSNVTMAQTVHLKIRVNGTEIYISSWIENIYSSYRGHSAFGNITSLPLWLPEGTSLGASDNAAYVSVIEFNVVP
jgi:hypothetical protein